MGDEAVVDLGCGPGAVLVVMAERVGPAGYVTGIDSDPEAVAAAREAIVAAGVGNATVRRTRRIGGQV
ncbi:MAG: Methyltransferase domain [Chloroflexi bacterium]|nr:Methyltransferase domain [Chloroflexota bacterium]